MKNYKQLKVWQNGKQIVRHTYEMVSELKSNDAYVFSSQILRAALSVPSNIAEGSSRKSEKEYRRYLEIALGSTFELETQIELLIELHLVPEERALGIIGLINEEQRMIYGLMNVLSPLKSR